MNNNLLYFSMWTVTAKTFIASLPVMGFGGYVGMEDLTEFDRKLFEYLREGDYETNKWSTPSAAKKLGASEDEVYESLANLAKHLKDNVWIYYKDGGLRIATE